MTHQPAALGVVVLVANHRVQVAFRPLYHHGHVTNHFLGHYRVPHSKEELVVLVVSVLFPFHCLPIMGHISHIGHMGCQINISAGYPQTPLGHNGWARKYPYSSVSRTKIPNEPDWRSIAIRSFSADTLPRWGGESGSKSNTEIDMMKLTMTFLFLSLLITGCTLPDRFALPPDIIHFLEA